MRKLILTRGIQGSGKSTWAKNWVAEDPENRLRINWDNFREMFGTKFSRKREKVIGVATEAILESIMSEQSYDIVLDNMNFNSEKWIKIAETYGYEIAYVDFFDTPLEECIRRDSLRENPIGEKVIRDTYNRYKSIIEG